MPRVSNATVMLLAALEQGPGTVQELAERAGVPFLSARTLLGNMMARRRVVRVDGLTKFVGVAGRAIYALPGSVEPAPPPMLPRDKAPLVQRRDPCPRCGVRADLGCKHRAAEQPERLAW